MRESLTDKEKDVLIYAMQGFDVQATARKISRSTATVKTHRAGILSKYDAPNMIRAAILHLYDSGTLKELP